MKLSSLLMLFFLSLVIPRTHWATALQYQDFAGAVTKVKRSILKNSIITIIKNKHDENYLLKQIRFNGVSKRPAKLVFEMVALEMGHAIGVPLNYACIIPAGIQFPGKMSDLPVTLHAFVPGIQFRDYDGKKYRGLSISQKNKAGERVGLTKSVIHHMSCHKDLPAMVALDTFVSNAGRGSHNFFYNEITDSFYGIDMASAFSHNLCGLSCERIEELLHDTTYQCTHNEYKGLKRYYKAFKKLITLYPPDQICRALDRTARLAGFYNDDFYDKNVQACCIKYIEHSKTTIHENYQDALRLQGLLEQLLKVQA